LAVLGAINGELFFARGGVGLTAVLVTLAGVCVGVLAGGDFLLAGVWAFTADLLGAGAGALETTALAPGLDGGFFAAGLAADLTTVFTTLLPVFLPGLLPTTAAGFFALVFFAGVLLTKVSSQR
jgi:hypothetical protein